MTGFDRKFSEIYKEHAYITPSGIMSRSTVMQAIKEMGQTMCCGRVTFLM